MKEKIKLGLFIVLDIFLLAGLLYAGSLWVRINNTLTNPCPVCAGSNQTVINCMNIRSLNNPFKLDLNISGINFNLEIPNQQINITKNKSMPLF